MTLGDPPRKKIQISREKVLIDKNAATHSGSLEIVSPLQSTEKRQVLSPSKSSHPKNGVQNGEFPIQIAKVAVIMSWQQSPETMEHHGSSIPGEK